MEVAGVTLTVIMALVPGINRLLGSVACRNEARAKTKIIRARYESNQPRNAVGHQKEPGENNG
ncbi:hypothetical protein ACFT9I_11005 [Streptomyces sp. NPDC057137]|uniref:hypothetical protein n=1 Tax=Streptomyces sp. NPDC057137 TaxID=3346030 RepID=UPI0036368880